MIKKIHIPPNPSTARPSTLNLLKDIWEFDQFDDWLPDPMYYEDQRLNEDRAVQRIENIWEAGEIAEPTREALYIPRGRGQTVPVISLPLDARVCAHGVIAAMAPRIASVLIPDKVYGFEFSRDNIPLFSQPGDGLATVLENVITAALYDDFSAKLRILDVLAFSRNTNIERLELILQQSGARPDETEFVRQMIQPGLSGLPSIDDAFAFLYNFYLQPVDQVLADATINFFRYRDEYFVLDAAAKQTVEQQLWALGLRSRVVMQSPNLNDVFNELTQQMIASELGEAEEVIGNIAYGKLIAQYQCSALDAVSKICESTDQYELVYKPSDTSGVPELFHLSSRICPLDGVQIIPLLRAIHKRRLLGVLLRPPFNAATKEFVQYRQDLALGRCWLYDALDTALNNGTDWQITWVTPLLSDLGPLQDKEITLLLKILATTTIGVVAKSQVRLALARSSSLSDERFWVDPSESSTNYQFRTALLGARYLVNRGNNKPWARLQQSAASTEPELLTYLRTNITG